MDYKNIGQFLIYCFIAIFSSVLLVFLMSEVFGVKKLYAFLQEQGSLIAGIIGFAGVFILISNQNKTTREMIINQNQTTKSMIDSNMNIMRSEALEAQKVRAIELIINIGYKFDTLKNQTPYNFNSWRKDPSTYKFFNDIKPNVYFVDKFIDIYSDDPEGKSCKDCIKQFLYLFESSNWITGRGEYRRSLFVPILGCMTRIYVSSGYGREIIDNNFYLSLHADDPIQTPIQLLNDFESFTGTEISSYIINYMTLVVLPTLINVVGKIEVDV